MDEFLRVELHEEYAKRMEEEHRRQNHRINDIEDRLKENERLLRSVENLAESMKQMQAEQVKQGERLDALEGRDGEKWRKATGYVLSAIISIIIGFALGKIGIM